MPGTRLTRINDLKIGKGLYSKSVTFAGVIFLFIPIVVLIVYSFNDSKVITVWEGFSFKWYKVMFGDRSIWNALKNSLIVAFLNTLFSTLLGTMAALVLGKYVFKGKNIFQNILYIPIIIPEIIFGIALLTFYMMIKLPLGILSITCSHITFSISFVTFVVLAKIKNFDKNIEEASLDLGANRWQTFIRIILPNISPGIISGALLAFTLSIDDFVITFFTSGVGSTTLPLKIYSMIKFGVTPEINAVSTLMILFTLIIISAVAFLQRSKLKIKTVLYITYTLGAIALFSIITLLIINKQDEKRLNIYNWSDYMDETLLTDFEKKYGIKITYDYFNDNDELLAKIKMGASGYDIIVPTDYIVKTMIEGSLLAKINFDNIPNYSNIEEKFKHLPFDPSGQYYIPYAYGFSGIGYNSNFVKEKIETWMDLWNPRYKNKIIMLDDVRDVFMVAFKILGYSANDTNPAHLQEAYDLLVKQKSVIKKYESSMTKDLLLNHEVYLAHIWSGNLLLIAAEKPEFKFVVPKEGTLMFVDNLAIPKDAPHKENAEKFINFILEPENTAKIINKVCYAMPNPKALEYVEDEIKNNKSIFPPQEVLDKCEILQDLGEYNQEIDRTWTKLKSK